MFPECPGFDAVCDQLDDKAFAWDLRRRPVRRRPSDGAVLDPETVIVTDCEPGVFRSLVRETGAEDISEAMHARDLERAAQPPVIEVTVTTPPDGIPRAEMATLVQRAVARFAGPARTGAATDPFPVSSRGRRVLVASRPRFRRGRVPPEAAVSEDDTPTQVLPAVREDGFAHVEEVYLP